MDSKRNTEIPWSDLIKPEVDLSSIFHKKAEYNGYFYEYELTRDEVFQNIQSYDFDISSDYLTFYTKPIRKNGRNDDYETIQIGFLGQISE